MTILELKEIVAIAQGLVIIFATLFTSWWAYKTFAHKQKLEEIKNVLDILTEFGLETGVVQKWLNHEEKYDSSRFVSLTLDLHKETSKIVFLGKNNRNKILVEFYKFRKVLAKELFNKKKLSKGEFEAASKECTLALIEFNQLLFKIAEKYI